MSAHGAIFPGSHSAQEIAFFQAANDASLEAELSAARGLELTTLEIANRTHQMYQDRKPAVPPPLPERKPE